MKTIKFRPALATLILEGKKTTTWRLFDDKDLQAGDEVELMNSETEKIFGYATLTDVNEKAIKDLDEHDWEGHERFPNDDAMYAAYHTYYPGKEIGPNTILKILHFALQPKTESVKKQLLDEGLLHIYEWKDLPNTEYPSHKHQGKVSLYITDGSISFVVDGKTIELKKGDRFDVPVAKEHTAKVGELGCSYIVGEMIEGDS